MGSSGLSWSIRGLSLLVLCLVQLIGYEPGITSTGLALLLIVLGIPHGAADHLIFRARHPERQWRNQPWQFLGFYSLLVILYGILWYLFPAVAFLLFVGVCVYHFGQSYGGKGGMASQLAWGSFVLLFPVMLHYPEAAPIIERMAAKTLAISVSERVTVCDLLIVANVALPLLEASRHRATRREVARRLLDLALLTALYLSTDLLLGFGLFFLLWHSVPAAAEQWRYPQRRAVVVNMQGYLRELLPLTLGAIGTLGGLYLWISSGRGSGIDLGVEFMLMSLITLPHAFLIDRVYR